MDTPELISEIIATYQRHGWQLRRVLLRPETRAGLVAELFGLKVDVLLTGSSPGALAAKKASGTIPIVMVASDPVGLGLVDSLARPGGNVTGLSYFNEAILAKRLEMLKELVMGLARREP